MKQPFDVGLCNSIIQANTIAMTDIVATGSMLQGHKAKALADVDQAAALELAERMLVNVQRLIALIKD